MSLSNLLRLVLLAAIWGASFMLLRVAAPVFGAPWVIGLRLAIAALFLAAVAALMRRPLPVRAHWRHFLFVGVMNSALPFLLFALAAQTLPASLLAILNATAPLWGTAISALWLRTPVSASVVTGLLLGLAGVGVLVGGNAAVMQADWLQAVGLALLAPVGYGIATAWAKRTAGSVEPFANAHGSMWAAALVCLPLLPFFSPPVTPAPGHWWALLALGVVCTGAAYLLYFRLVKDAGPTAALSVTFLIPVFGVLWGVLLLDEAVGWTTLAGGAVVLLGTALSTGFIRWPGAARADGTSR